MKKKILCIVGSSGSGKTMASLYLKNELNANVICSYTTRPMREGESNGVEHIFVDEKEMPDKSEMIAYTYFGGYHYWATKEQIKGKLSIYVIDEKGLEFLREKFSDEYIIYSLYVYRPQKLINVDKERMNRDENRPTDLKYNRVVVNKDKNMFLNTMSYVYSELSRDKIELYNRDHMDLWLTPLSDTEYELCTDNTENFNYMRFSPLEETGEDGKIFLSMIDPSGGPYIETNLFMINGSFVDKIIFDEKNQKSY